MRGEKPLELLRTIVLDSFEHRSWRTPRIQRAMHVIEAEYADGSLTTGAIAERLGTNRHGYVAEFHEQVGMYPKEYLRQVRLDHAAVLLVSTRLSVKEIWVGTGYSAASKFDHDFKRRFGLAPREYRARAVPIAPLDICSGVSNLPPSSNDPPKPFRGRKDRTILIIDDDEGTRETIGKFLALEGYSAWLATTGKEGARIAMSHQLDLILLDYHLEDVDGIGWLVALRKHGVETPVIVLTADIEIEDRKAELDALHATALLKLQSLDDIADAIAFRCAA